MFKVFLILCIFVSVIFAWPGSNNNFNYKSQRFVYGGENVDGYYLTTGYAFDVEIGDVISDNPPYLDTIGGNGKYRCYFTSEVLSNPGTHSIYWDWQIMENSIGFERCEWESHNCGFTKSKWTGLISSGWGHGGHIRLNAYNLDTQAYELRTVTYGAAVTNLLYPVNMIGNHEVVESSYNPADNYERPTIYKFKYYIVPDNPVTNIRLVFYYHINYAPSQRLYYVPIEGDLATPGLHEIDVNIAKPDNLLHYDTGLLVDEVYQATQYGIRIEYDAINQHGYNLYYHGHEDSTVETCLNYMNQETLYGQTRRDYVRFTPYIEPANKYACKFGGTDEFDRLTTNYKFSNIRANGYAFSFMFKSNEKSTMHFVGNSDTGGYDSRFHFGVKGDGWYALLGDDRNAQDHFIFGDATPYLDKKWHHVLVNILYQTSTIDVYVDGSSTPVASKAFKSGLRVGAHTPNGSEFYWGSGWHDMYSFDGEMDNMCIIMEPVDAEDAKFIYDNGGNCGYARVTHTAINCIFHCGDGEDNPNVLTNHAYYRTNLCDVKESPSIVLSYPQFSAPGPQSIDLSQGNEKDINIDDKIVTPKLKRALPANAKVKRKNIPSAQQIANTVKEYEATIQAAVLVSGSPATQDWNAAKRTAFRQAVRRAIRVNCRRNIEIDIDAIILDNIQRINGRRLLSEEDSVTFSVSFTSDNDDEVAAFIESVTDDTDLGSIINDELKVENDFDTNNDLDLDNNEVQSTSNLVDVGILYYYNPDEMCQWVSEDL